MESSSQIRASGAESAPGGDDLRLIRRVAERDRAAFEDLYYRYHRRTCRFVFRLLGHTDRVEEIVNDVMLVVWRRAGSFDGRSRLSTWIFGIAYRRTMKHLSRTRIERGEVPLEAAELVEPEPADARLHRRRLRQRLHRALAALSPKHRAVVELACYHGYSYPEIAEIVGCPVNTVKTRMFHARKRLRDLLPSPESVPGTREEAGGR